MSSSRHFFKNQSADQTRQEITADIAAARKGQRELQAAGQHRDIHKPVVDC
ncbi:hypothetical protein [Streptomyces sp. NRRL F-5135]|uniref:hypothetical protein n=1 Tax=Streptomyces sp. NRRL F-5135 TaxID=1463858 RepID=UPI000ADC5274|nr:hypothetical protein [Streptomyces sp. NRRL F-5135]